MVPSSVHIAHGRGPAIFSGRAVKHPCSVSSEFLHIRNSSVFAVCGTAARRSQGTGFASLRVLDSGVLPCRWVNQGGKAALCQKASTGYNSDYMTHSFPLAGRADGGKEKSRITVKNLPIPTTTEIHADFCVHAALGRLRFVSGSTAQLLYLVDFSISGTGVRVKVAERKKCSCRRKIYEGKGL